jgi:hypothetical protein
MNMLDQHVLRQQSIRLALVGIIYMSTLDTYTKMFLILFLDIFKSVYFLFTDFIPERSKSKLYHKVDKLVDYFSYVIVFDIVRRSNRYTHTQEYLLFSALIWRYFGVYKMLQSDCNNTFQEGRMSLLYFPDLFKELILVFYLQKKFNASVKLQMIVFGFLLIIKLYIEYKFHVKQEGGVDIFRDIINSLSETQKNN